MAPDTLSTLQAVARTLGDDERAVAQQLAHAGTAELRLFWQRQRVRLELQRLRRMRRMQVQLWLPRGEQGCDRCRGLHGQVVSADTPAEQLVQAECPALHTRLCPLAISGWIDRATPKTPLAN